MKRYILHKCFFIVVAIILIGKHYVSNKTNTVSKKGTKAIVLYVIDGDTIKAEDINGQKSSIRFIGIDTPESRKNKKAYRDAKRVNINKIISLGKKAKKFTEKLLPKGAVISIEYDVQKFDKYGRILAYVYYNNEMINLKLVEEGYALPLTIPPNIKYADKFQKALKKARLQQKGLWKEKAFRQLSY